MYDEYEHIDPKLLQGRQLVGRSVVDDGDGVSTNSLQRLDIVRDALRAKLSCDADALSQRAHLPKRCQLRMTSFSERTYWYLQRMSEFA